MVRYACVKATPIAEPAPVVPTAPASARVLDEQPAREHAARKVNAADRTNPRIANRHRIVNLLQAVSLTACRARNGPTREPYSNAAAWCWIARAQRVQRAGRALQNVSGASWSSEPPRPLLRADGRRWFDAQHSAGLGVRQQIQQPIRTLAHVTDALMQLGQQRLATKFFHLLVEQDPLEVTGSRNLARAQ